MLGDRAARWPSTLPYVSRVPARPSPALHKTYVGARALCAVVSHIALDDQSVTIAHDAHRGGDMGSTPMHDAMGGAR